MLRNPLENSKPDLPLLITGITGVAGYNAFHYFRRKYPGQVFGIRPLLTPELEGEGIIGQDAEAAVGVRALFERFGFRSVLNSAGNCALKSCELNPAMARQINVASAEVIVENVRRHGCRLVHLSSDLVFSGTRGGNHVEGDPTDPVTVYGKTMVQAEKIIASGASTAAILRISLPMGPSFNRHAGAIDWIASRFRKHRPATLYYDEVRSSTYCDDLNPVFARFLAEKASGVIHLGGPKSLSLFQIAQIINRVGGYDPKLLKGCPRIMAGPIPPRAGDVSMCSDKLIRLLGNKPFRPWPAEESLNPAHMHWHFHREETESSFSYIVERLYHYCPVLSAQSLHYLRNGVNPHHLVEGISH